MKYHHGLRVAACMLFTFSLLSQTMPAFGQRRSSSITPPLHNLRPARPIVSSETARRASASTAISADFDKRELERARSAADLARPQAPQLSPFQVKATRELTFTPAYTAFLPLIINQTYGLYGYVTQMGAPTAGITVLLRFYDGVQNSTIATTTTNAEGMYTFPGKPGLSAGQEYWIRYDNNEEDSSRLYNWISAYITTYAAGSNYFFGTFDLANVFLGTPASRAVIAPPTVFTWTKRLATPSDSYEMVIFDPTEVTTRTFSSGFLGYTNTYRLASLPTGFSLLVQYGWALDIRSPDGGLGSSYYYNPFWFGKSTGIQGRVTLNGVNASSISVQLIKYNGSTYSVAATTSTAGDGIYQFNSAASLTSGQRYYVYYSNTSNTGRLFAWYTANLTSYTAGQRAYAGNFDIANIPLVSPPNAGTLAYPYTFRWTARVKSPTDFYSIELYGPSGSPYTIIDAGLTNTLSLQSIPAGFSTGTPYGWDMLTFSPDGGVGVAFQFWQVTFQ